MKNKKYCYSFDDDYYISGTFDSKEEAIEEAKKEFKKYNWENDYPEKIIYLAEAFLYEDNFDSLADNLIEDMQEKALDDNEYAGNYMELSEEHREIFEKRLEKMIKDFQKEFGYEPNFYEIERIGKVEF